MYRVELRYEGALTWSRALPPVSLHAAETQAKALAHSLTADEARIVDASTDRLVDVRA